MKQGSEQVTRKRNIYTCRFAFIPDPFTEKSQSVKQKHSFDGFHVAPIQTGQHSDGLFEASCRVLHPLIDRTQSPTINCSSTASIDQQNPINTECSKHRAVLCLLMDRIQSLSTPIHHSYQYQDLIVLQHRSLYCWLRLHSAQKHINDVVVVLDQQLSQPHSLSGLKAQPYLNVIVVETK